MEKALCLFSVVAMLAACEPNEYPRLDALEAWRATAESTLEQRIAVEAAARMQADVDLLAQAFAQAKAYTDVAVRGEAELREQGDADTLAAAKAYTDQAVKPGGATKQPHLVVDQTGEDLGVLIPGTAGFTAASIVISPKVNSEIDIVNRHTIWFEAERCGGKPHVQDVQHRRNRSYNGTDNHVYKTDGGWAMRTMMSRIDLQNGCVDIPAQSVTGTVPVLELRIPSMYYPSHELRVDLR